MRAVDAMVVEISKYKRDKLSGKGTNPPLVRALTAAKQYFEWRDGPREMSLETFIDKLSSDPLFIDGVKRLGPKGAKILVDHFRESNPGGWG